MKKFIIRWLGIEEFPEQAILKAVRLEVKDAIDNPKFVHYVHNIINAEVRHNIEGEAKQVASEFIKNKVDTEEFIDKVVQRINSKQI